jgi:methylamine dehydrogenase heavy chain
MKRMLLTAGLIASMAGVAVGADFPDPLPVGKIPNVTTLPAVYPASWVFTNTVTGVEVIDTRAADPGEVRGQIGEAPFMNLQVARTRPEVYLAETFYSRGTRGVRTDVVTVYDTSTLAPTGEIVLGGGLRYLSGPQPNTFQLSGDEAFGFVFGFTPAASVKVLDLAARKRVSEVPIPGCALIYPTGPRSFSTLCANGTLLSVRLDDAGKVVGQAETKPFNNLADDPLFSQPARIGDVAYFPSLKGSVQPIDFSGPEAKLLPAWSLVSPDEAKANWRPSGWQLAAGGPDGRLYVIMQPNGADGTHKKGGPEVWVFDVATHAKVATIKLKTPAASIALTSEAEPRVVVAAAPPDNPLGLTLDTYDAKTGAALGSLPLGPFGGTPVIFPVRR